ncbi:RNA methyltransferase tRNA(m5U54)methyltransferase [Puttea exsequens]|nr:RNA methyltransferase tRNA(m5U54)methyltransferase [Puttea exsequens]
MPSLPAAPNTSSTPTPTTPPISVTYDNKTYTIAREGTAELLALQTPKTTKNRASGAQAVFYNPIQQYNRDLSVLAIRAFGEDLAAIRRARSERRGKKLGEDGGRGVKRMGGRGKDGEGGEDVRGERVEGFGSRLMGLKRKRAEEEGDEGRGEPVRKKGQRDDGSNAIEVSVSSRHDLHEQNGGEQNATTVIASEEVSQDPEISKGQSKPEEHAQANGEVVDKVVRDAPDGPAAQRHGKAHTQEPQLRILDALSATGLRALRYAKEIPMATSITANDLSPSATASIALNIKHNDLSENIILTTSNAIEHMHRVVAEGLGGSKHYNVIDLDPYGTAAPFLDAAVQALADGGLLCVTCTDAGVFASLGYLEKTYSQYGGLPLRGGHAHEGGLRLILHAIATASARYGIAIEPLLSLSIDFYARVFVRVHRSPAEVKFLASKTMVVYNCDAGCGAWAIQHLARAKEKRAKNGDILYNFTSALAPSADTRCEHCGFKTHLAGPMWGGPLHNPYFIQRILNMLPTLDQKVYGTIPRIEGMLNIALHESLDDLSALSPPSPDRPIPPLNPAIQSSHPFFFMPSTISRTLHCVSPSDAALRGAFMHLGYRTTRSHTKAGGICTDAPWSVIWEVMREWVRQKSPLKVDALKEGTAGWGIMREDRSRKKVLEMQRQLRDVLGKTGGGNVESLIREVEAALWRVSKLDEREQMAQNGGEPGKDAMVDDKGGGGAASEVPARGEQHQTQCISDLKVVFDERLGKEPQGKRMVRYQVNPRPDWGPMNRARGDS